MGDWTWTEEEVAEQLAKAEEATLLADETEPRAVAARYDRATRRLIIELGSGALFIIPVDRLQGLQGAADEDLLEVVVLPLGELLEWPSLDWHVSVPAILAGQFGSKAWMERQRAQQAPEPPRTAQG